MGAAEPLATSLTEMLTWAEIQTRFPYRYVVVLEEDEDISGGMAAVHGRVAGHSSSPNELLATIDVWRERHELIGFYYTGVGMPDEDRNAVRAQR